MGQKIDLTTQVQGVLPEINGGAGPNSGTRFGDADVLVGAVNGTNTNFTLSNAPNPAASLILFLNKILQIQGVDYTVAGNIVTMSVAPLSVGSFLGWYRYKGFSYGLGLLDTLLMSDGFAFDVPSFSKDTSLVDTLTMTDIVAKTVSSNSSISLEDFLVMNDRIVATVPSNTFLLSDSLTLTDGIAARATISFAFVDQLVFADPVSGSLSGGPAFGRLLDGLTYADSIALGLSGSISDQMSSSDAVVVVKN